MNTLALLVQTARFESAAPPDALSITPAVVAAIAVSILGGALSVFVVLKRLAFIGQGVSHAAFGGVGLALVLGITGATGSGAAAQMAIVLAFSVLAALWIAALTRSERGRTDTAIGVVLSAAMALGFVLFTIAESRHAHDAAGDSGPAHADEHHVIEEILFGNILTADWTKAITAIVFTIVILAIAWSQRRKLIFWAFDEPVCDAYGVSAGRMTNLLLVLLALAIVMSMQIAGVVLAAAMLVLPGAAALNLTSRLRPVFACSILLALAGAGIGFAAGSATDQPIGPSIVLTHSAIYLGALLTKTLRARLRSH